MVRTQIYITQRQQEALERLAKSRKVTKSDLIREQIDKLVVQAEESGWKKQMMKMAGMWQDRADLPDFNAIRTQLQERQTRLFGKRK
jgi:Ribbon-helix-helix protein, copG family